MKKQVLLSVILLVGTLFVGCETDTDTGFLPDGEPFSSFDIEGKWNVSQSGVYLETDSVDGHSSDGYPYTSEEWDTAFSFASLSMRGDTLMIEGWKTTTMSLSINFWGVGTGNSIELTGTRMNSPTTPWIDGSEHYHATARTTKDGAIEIDFDCFAQYTVKEPPSQHGIGEKSSARLTR